MEQATSQQLEKLLNATLPRFFSNVKKVIVKEEDLDQHTYYIHVWVIMDDQDMFMVPNDPNVTDFAKIQKKIRDFSHYMLLHVNQITFAKEQD